MKEYEFHESNDHYDDFMGSSNLISSCCGARAWGEIMDDCGICSDCKDHATFEQDIDEE